MELQRDNAIGIDLDDTIANTAYLALDYMRDNYGVKAGMDDWTEFDLKKLFGLSNEQIMKMYFDLWSDHRRISIVDPKIPDITEALSKRYRLYLVTATVGSEKSYTKWLQEHNIKFDGIIRVKHSIEKVIVGSNHGINYYIDDHPIVAKSVSEAGRQALLFRRSWNRSFAEANKDPLIKVVNSWAEIGKFFSDTKPK